MAELRMIAKDGLARRDIGDFAETATALDIERTLDLVRLAEGPEMTCIAGAPGTGKTTAVRRYCDQLGERAIYYQAACGEGTPWNLACGLALLFVNAPERELKSQVRARHVLADYIGRRLLVVDEAQYLDQRHSESGGKGMALEWLRATAETGGFDLVFCGDMKLSAALHDIPQLKSRILRPILIPEVSRADVTAVVDGTPYATEPAVNNLHPVALMPGGLRNVKRVVSLALDGARGRGEHPTLAHLKAATLDMKLAPKGVK